MKLLKLGLATFFCVMLAACPLLVPIEQGSGSASTHNNPPTNNQSGTRDVEAGPIWNQADAERKCPALATRHGLRWTGHWHTTVPGQMSVCQLTDDAVARQDEAETFDTVFYFEEGRAVLGSEARRHLLAIAHQLKAEPRQLRLEGHVRQVGSREEAMALGERRAKAVRDYLIVQGVSSSAIDVVSYGREKPQDPSGTAAAHAQNDRVEISW